MTTTEKPNSSSYHHGNLQQSLLQAAIELIRSKGVDGLSMRKLAEQVGVSRSALYHHYTDKNHLLCDIASNGFECLSEKLKTIEPNANSNLEQSFRSHIQTYIKFAAENPEQYNLMFGGTIWKSGAEPTEKLRQVSSHSFKSYVHILNALQEAGRVPRELSTLRMAQVSWATLHGMSRFMIDGIYVHQEVLDELTDYAVNMMLQVFPEK